MKETDGNSSLGSRRCLGYCVIIHHIKVIEAIRPSYNFPILHSHTEQFQCFAQAILIELE